MNKRLVSLKPWLFFIIYFLFLRLPSLFEPYWYGDEAIYLVLGQAIRKGLTLYSQIHDNKPPSLYYLASLSQTVFGFRLFLLLWMIPTHYFFYKLSRKFFNSFFSKLSLFVFITLTSIPLIEGNIANAEIFMLLPTILAFLLFNPSNLNSLTASSLFLGVAFTFKMPALLDFAALSFFFLLTSSKKFLPFLSKAFIFVFSFISPFLIFAIFYWSKNALPEFLNSSLLQNFPYLSSWQTGGHSSSPLQGGLLYRGIVLVVFWLYSLILYYRKKINQNHLLLLLWLSSAIFGVFLSGRPYPHYLLQAVPPFCLTFIYLFYKNNSFIKSVLILSVMAILGLTTFNFYFYRNRGYYKAFYLNLNNPQVFQDFFGPQVSQSQQIVDYLSSKNIADKKLFIWGDAPYIYAQLNILPSDKYTVAYHIVDFKTHSQTLDRLKINTPEFILYYPMDNRPFDKLDQFIYRYYALDYVIDDVSIYRKR